MVAMKIIEMIEEHGVLMNLTLFIECSPRKTFGKKVSGNQMVAPDCRHDHFDKIIIKADSHSIYNHGVQLEILDTKRLDTMSMQDQSGEASIVNWCETVQDAQYVCQFNLRVRIWPTISQTALRGVRMDLSMVRIPLKISYYYRDKLILRCDRIIEINDRTIPSTTISLDYVLRMDDNLMLLLDRCSKELGSNKDDVLH